MKNFKYIIIGGGISGCIASEILNDNSLIIERSCSLGGEMGNTMLGPKLYHYTEQTATFFEKYTKSISKVRSITLNNGVKTDDKSTYDKKIGYSFSNSQNSSLSEFQALNLDLQSFYNKQNALLSAQVIKIDINNRLVYVLCNKAVDIYHYEYLISTIDYELFIRLCGLKNCIELEKRGVLYYNFNGIYSKEFEYLNDYNFWYNLTDKEFFRCTNLSKENHTVELFVENSRNIIEQICRYFKSVTNGLVYYNPSAKIWTKFEAGIKYNTLKWANIYLLGRNALCNHDRIQDVISSAYNIKKEIEK